MTTKYDLNQEVYAIDINSDNYCKIYKCIIVSISIDERGISYYLRALGETEEWDEAVSEHSISMNIDKLIEKVKQLWQLC